ncbi:MAG: hypothetical protein J0I14_10655 [Propionibacteriaceae bacterium]|jgi:hypothetical protein|nr:hypothetical protein [Propionibacteriaceae bacterium]
MQLTKAGLAGSLMGADKGTVTWTTEQDETGKWHFVARWAMTFGSFLPLSAESSLALDGVEPEELPPEVRALVDGNRRGTVEGNQLERDLLWLWFDVDAGTFEERLAEVEGRRKALDRVPDDRLARIDAVLSLVRKALAG